MLESVADISKRVSITFKQEADKTHPDAAFKYGWCRTDHKSGKNLHHTDYLEAEPYVSFVKKCLKRFGLPCPKENEIFRGTNHDLLFLDSHGVVLRIGPLDVKDLMNPGIIQPLGWFEDRSNMIGHMPLTVAIYPGIELYNDYKDSKRKTSLADFMAATGQSNIDNHSYNKGIIRVLDDDTQEEVAVEMLLDPDNEFSEASNEMSRKRSDAMEAATKSVDNFGEAITRTLYNIFNAAKDVQWYQKAYEVHEPLRRLFWESFKGKSANDMPDAVCMRHFWNTCARVTNNPMAAVMPVWKTKEVDGKTNFVREDVYMPHVILYRPWTGLAADKIIVPINQSPELTAAVRLAHAMEIGTKPEPMEVSTGGTKWSATNPGLLTRIGNFIRGI